jgi:2-polyprenyl-6-methoxyphenol hydroxylase-like FAD-dependent oxidoreductase
MVASNPSIDLIIVGGGPVGLTAAIEAQRLGLSYRIIERKEKRRSNDSRAVVLHPRMLELLQTNTGFIQSISERAEKLPVANIEFVNDKKTISILNSEQNYGDTEYPSLYFLPQYLTEKSLEETLAKGGG